VKPKDRYNPTVDSILGGRRVLVTRRPSQAGALSARLRALGAHVVEIPAIDIAPPDEPGPLDGALTHATDYDWLVLTSPNAVRAVAGRLEALGNERVLSGARPALAAVGPSTADAISKQLTGRPVDLLPASEFRAEGLLAAFTQRGLVEGERVLLPVADRARDVLAEGLRRLGAVVDVVVAYRTVAPADLTETIAARLGEGVDLALFASPSAAENFASAAGDRARGLPVAVMGPVTERAARALGLDVRAVASPSTLDGLVAAAVAALTTPPAL
jgi:uroporphyrinogen-III synthase